MIERYNFKDEQYTILKFDIISEIFVNFFLSICRFVKEK